MSEVLKDFDFPNRRGRQEVYPWPKWFAVDPKNGMGKPHRIYRGKDMPATSLEKLADKFRKRANLYGLKLRIAIDRKLDAIVMQVVGVNEMAPQKSAKN